MAIQTRSYEFDKVDYNLIAIHTSIEDYRLAFHQSKLPINLSKKEEVQIKIKEENNIFKI
jgi:hypothetical protein